ncbi:MAG: xylose isomerase, partial [Rubripirellula sp.]
FYAHIGSMDAFAKGLKVAAAIRADQGISGMIKERYKSWDEGIGAKIESGSVGFADLERYMLEKEEVEPNVSGRQEWLENLVNRYLDRV